MIWTTNHIKQKTDYQMRYVSPGFQTHATGTDNMSCLESETCSPVFGAQCSVLELPHCPHDAQLPHYHHEGKVMCCSPHQKSSDDKAIIFTEDLKCDVFNRPPVALWRSPEVAEVQQL